MGRPTRHQKRYQNVGRPSKIDDTLVLKLEDAFRNGFTDEMACLYAGIGETAFYKYCERNPQFAERKEKLKRSPDLMAQTRLVKDLESTGGARWWAEHRMAEFMPKSKVEHTGKIEHEMLPPSPAMLEAMRLYEAKRREEIRNEARTILPRKIENVVN